MEDGINVLFNFDTRRLRTTVRADNAYASNITAHVLDWGSNPQPRQTNAPPAELLTPWQYTNLSTASPRHNQMQSSVKEHSYKLIRTGYEEN